MATAHETAFTIQTNMKATRCLDGKMRLYPAGLDECIQQSFLTYERNAFICNGPIVKFANGARIRLEKQEDDYGDFDLEYSRFVVLTLPKHPDVPPFFEHLGPVARPIYVHTSFGTEQIKSRYPESLEWQDFNPQQAKYVVKKLLARLGLKTNFVIKAHEITGLWSIQPTYKKSRIEGYKKIMFSPVAMANASKSSDLNNLFTVDFESLASGDPVITDEDPSYVRRRFHNWKKRHGIDWSISVRMLPSGQHRVQRLPEGVQPMRGRPKAGESAPVYSFEKPFAGEPAPPVESSDVRTFELETGPRTFDEAIEIMPDDEYEKRDKAFWDNIMGAIGLENTAPKEGH